MLSPLAKIDKDAKLANNVTVEPFALIHNDVEIGEGTTVMSHAVLMPGTRIGKNCKIYPGAVISVTPIDLKYENEYTTVEIGDNTSIREYATIHRGTKANWKTTIGSNCVIMVYVHLGHDCVIGNNALISGYCALAGHVQVEDWAILEGFTKIQQFTRVGAHSFLAANSSVRKNVPPFVKAAREPLSYAGVNTVGLVRRNFTPERIAIIEDIYRILYVKGYALPTALKEIKDTIPDSEDKTLILDFIEHSENGIIKGPSLISKSKAIDEKS